MNNKKILTAVLIASLLPVIGFAVPTQVLSQVSTATNSEQDIIDTQDTQQDSISSEDKQVNGLEFTPRWGAVLTLDPEQLKVLFADCLSDEFALTPQYMFEDVDVQTSQSFPIGLPSPDGMTWLAVVENTGNEEQAVSLGVICAGENDGFDGVKLDTRTKIVIDETVNRFVIREGDVITNINNIINIRQSIVQNAIQIIKITGNNNTVNAVITQTANQLASQNASTVDAATVSQAIEQNARQEGVLQGNDASLSQRIQQEAQQQAQAQGGASINQGINQNASQFANVTGPGNATIIDQEIDQEAEQIANATSDGTEATIIEQLIEQQAEQESQLEDDQDQAAIEQDIEQEAEQEAQVEGEEERTPDPASPPEDASTAAETEPTSADESETVEEDNGGEEA